MLEVEEEHSLVTITVAQNCSFSTSNVCNNVLNPSLPIYIDSPFPYVYGTISSLSSSSLSITKMKFHIEELLENPRRHPPPPPQPPPPPYSPSPPSQHPPLPQIGEMI